MSAETPDYPVDYRGNQIHDEKRVRELRDDLQLVTGGYEVDQVLDHIGVEHDPTSVVAEDSYGCLWVDVEGGEYSEVWGIHKSVPYLDRIAVRLR